MSAFSAEGGVGDSYDVAVVGYRPTGVTAANLMGAMGLRVVVVERDAEIYAWARAISTDEEVVRNIGYEGRTYEDRWVVVDTEMLRPWPDHDRLRFRCDPVRPAVDCPTPLGHHRWEFPILTAGAPGVLPWRRVRPAGVGSRGGWVRGGRT